jgi:hypothetical protein
LNARKRWHPGLAEVAPWLAPWDMHRLTLPEVRGIEARYEAWRRSQQEA